MIFLNKIKVLSIFGTRPEAFEAGTVKLAGIIEDDIYNMANELIVNKTEYKKMAKAINPYGDGRASERIVAAILYRFGLGDKTEEFL